MPLFHAAWLYYLNNPALVINGLGLFYALSGTWLVFAAQWRSMGISRQATAGVPSRLDTCQADSYNPPHPQSCPASRINRMFQRIGFGCLALALLLSLLSTQV